MRQVHASSLRLVFGAALLLLPSLSSAQLILGQYENEAPLLTWNIFGPATAASLGRGETLLTFAADCSVALVNPALLVDLPGFEATFSASASSASLYRYAVVNTGVLSSRGNLTASLQALDFAGVSLSYKGWALAASASLSESYDRPGAYIEDAEAGFSTYTFSFRQEGVLRTFNLSLATRLGRMFRLGLGLNFVRGSLDRKTEETFSELGETIVISDEKSQDFSGFYLNGGIVAELSAGLDVALVFRAPYSRKARSSSALRYSAPLGETEISIEAKAADRIKHPWIIGLGAGYRVSSGWRVLSEVIFFDWSQYEVEYFGEIADRSFRDTFRIGLGAEHERSLRLFRRESTVLLRAGLSYDPQPMAEPRSAYTHLTLGAGLRAGKLALDVGGSLGGEKGSGRNLRVTRLRLTAGIRL